MLFRIYAQQTTYNRCCASVQIYPVYLRKQWLCMSSIFSPPGGLLSYPAVHRALLWDWGKTIRLSYIIAALKIAQLLTLNRQSFSIRLSISTTLPNHGWKRR